MRLASEAALNTVLPSLSLAADTSASGLGTLTVGVPEGVSETEPSALGVPVPMDVGAAAVGEYSWTRREDGVGLVAGRRGGTMDESAADADRLVER